MVKRVFTRDEILRKYNLDPQTVQGIYKEIQDKQGGKLNSDQLKKYQKGVDNFVQAVQGWQKNVIKLVDDEAAGKDVPEDLKKTVIIYRNTAYRLDTEFLYLSPKFDHMKAFKLPATPSNATVLQKASTVNTAVAAKNVSAANVLSKTGGVTSLDGIPGIDPTKTVQDTLSKVDLTEKGFDNAVGKIDAAAPSLKNITAAAGSAVGGGISGLASSVGSIKDKVGGGISAVTSKLPAGIQQVGKNLLDSVNPLNVLNSSVQDLKKIKGIYSDTVNRVSNVKSLASAGTVLSPNKTSNPAEIIKSAAKGQNNTFVFPKDYSRQLCFRMDFLEFERGAVFKPEKMLTKSTFILPLPRSIGVQQGISYAQQELGVFGEVEARTRVGDVNGVGDLLKETAQGAAGAVYRAAMQTDLGRTASLAAGFIPNPHLSNIFTGVGLRSFTFDIQLTPTSEDESVLIEYILDKLKVYSLPRRSGNFTTLEYPHEVAISFSEAGSTLVHKGPAGYKTPLDKLFKFQRCVITNMNVTVNSPGDQAFFRDYSPTEVTISLSFQENAISTADLYGREGAPATDDAYKRAFNNAIEPISSLPQPDKNDPVTQTVVGSPVS